MTNHAKLKAWTTLARAAIRINYAYRFNVLLGIVLTGLTIYLMTLIWRAAYGTSEVVAGIGLEQTLVYLTVVNLQVFFLQPEVAEDVQERIQEGQISFDLTRPVSYPSQLVAGAAGDMIGMLPMVLVALPVAFLLGELGLPSTLVDGIAYIASLLLAWVIAVQINMLIGLTSFWTLEMTGFQMVYSLISSFATGALIPLWFMPDILRAIVQLLPFQAIAYVPVSIYVGEAATGHPLTAIALQVFWCLILTLAIQWIWKKALHHTVIQGG